MGWVSTTLYHFFFVYTQLLNRVLSRLDVLNVLFLTELSVALVGRVAGIVNALFKYLASCFVS